MLEKEALLHKHTWTLLLCAATALLALSACAEPDSALGGSGGQPSADLGGAQDLAEGEPDMDALEPEPDLPPGDTGQPDLADDLVEDEPDLPEEDMRQSLLDQPCAEDPERCTFEGLICSVDRSDGAQVDITCQPLDESDGALGDSCQQDLSCQADLCLEDWLWRGCSQPCVEDADCPLEGWTCQERDLLGAGQGVARVCVPPDPDPCQGDADCPEGEVCTLQADREGAALVPVCQPAGEGGDLGDSCQVNQDCAAGICLDGFCATLCRGGEECSQEGQRCEETSWSQGDLSGDFNLCRTLPEMECLTNEDCAARGQVCGVIRFEDPVRLLCVDPLPEGDAPGAACDGSLSRNEQCADRLCLRNITDACTQACQVNQDCQGFPVEHQCTDFRFAGQIVRMCAQGCGHDASCDREGQLCTLNRNQTDDRFEFICRSPTGEDAPGSDCSEQVNCDHGICLIRRSGNEVLERVCTLPCETDADCPEELPVCDDAGITTPSGEDRQPLRVCNRN